MPNSEPSTSEPPPAYGSRAAKLLGAVTIQLEIITHFGRPEEKRKSITLRLTDKKETVDVGSVEF